MQELVTKITNGKLDLYDARTGDMFGHSTAAWESMSRPSAPGRQYRLNAKMAKLIHTMQQPADFYEQSN